MMLFQKCPLLKPAANPSRKTPFWWSADSHWKRPSIYKSFLTGSGDAMLPVTASPSSAIKPREIWNAWRSKLVNDAGYVEKFDGSLYCLWFWFMAFNGNTCSRKGWTQGKSEKATTEYPSIPYVYKTSSVTTTIILLICRIQQRCHAKQAFSITAGYTLPSN